MFVWNIIPLSITNCLLLKAIYLQYFLYNVDNSWKRHVHLKWSPISSSILVEVQESPYLASNSSSKHQIYPELYLTDISYWGIHYSVQSALMPFITNANRVYVINLPRIEPSVLLSSEKLAKSLQPTLERSCIQTAEPIVKCHTIL